MFGFCGPFGQQQYVPPEAALVPPPGPDTLKPKPNISKNMYSCLNETDIPIEGEPQYLDILMGRAKNSQGHSGNLIFQKLILANIKIYTKNTRGGKGHVVKCLLTFLREQKRVRFIKKLEDGTYVEVLDAKVLNDKVSHALRDVQFSDESKYCPPEADMIVKEFEEYSANQKGFEAVAAKRMKAHAGTIKEQNDTIRSLRAEVSSIQSKGSTETDRNGLADRLLLTQSMPKIAQVLAMAPTPKGPDDIEKSRTSDKKWGVDPEETESEEDEPPLNLPPINPRQPVLALQKKKVPKYGNTRDDAPNPVQSPSASAPAPPEIVSPSQESLTPQVTIRLEQLRDQGLDRPLKLPPIIRKHPGLTFQRKKAPKYGYRRDDAPNPVQSPSASAPAPPEIVSHSQAFLTPQVTSHVEQLRDHQGLVQSQREGSIRAARSQLEQLQAQDRMQLEQLLAAQEARRIQVLLSHGIDPRSFAGAATLGPSSTAAINLQATPASSATSKSDPSAVEEAHKPFIGMELLSDVADVLTKDPPAKAPAPLATPANLLSSQDSIALVGLGLAVPPQRNALGILGVLQNAFQHQNNVRQFESTLALAQIIGEIDPRYRDQLVAAGYETTEMKRRRLGGYPFP